MASRDDVSARFRIIGHGVAAASQSLRLLHDVSSFGEGYPASPVDNRLPWNSPALASVP
jgi:hypothetical protein